MHLPRLEQFHTVLRTGLFPKGGSGVVVRVVAATLGVGGGKSMFSAISFDSLWKPTGRLTPYN